MLVRRRATTATTPERVRISMTTTYRRDLHGRSTSCAGTYAGRRMRRHDVGPRRSQSVDALLRRTRLLAIVALLALAGGIVSDVVGGSFWARHALLASLAASVIVVILSVAVINELLERRRRQRW